MQNDPMAQNIFRQIEHLTAETITTFTLHISIESDILLLDIISGLPEAERLAFVTMDRQTQARVLAGGLRDGIEKLFSQP